MSVDILTISRKKLENLKNDPVTSTAMPSRRESGHELRAVDKEIAAEAIETARKVLEFVLERI